MGAILTHNFKSSIAQSYIDSLNSGLKNLYFFFGSPINQNSYNDDPDAQHYILEYYPYHNSNGDTLRTNDNYQRIKKSFC